MMSKFLHGILPFVHAAEVHPRIKIVQRKGSLNFLSATVKEIANSAPHRHLQMKLTEHDYELVFSIFR